MCEALYKNLLAVIAIAAAGAVIVVNAVSMLWAWRTGTTHSNVQGVLSCELGGVMLMTLSFRLYLLKKDEAAAQSSTRTVSCAGAVFVLLAGLFSLIVRGFLAYLKINGLD